MTQGDRTTLAEYLRLEAVGLGEIGSPFYAELERSMAEDVETGGPVWDILESRAGLRFDDASRLRLLGGVHRMVLAGTVPELARHYPSTGGDGDAAVRVVALPRPGGDPAARGARCVGPASRRPTKSAGRRHWSPGSSTSRTSTGLPLRLLELGASAGLNLRVDRYRYEQGGVGWGDPGSAVRFDDLWPDATPPLGATASIASRAGCDHDPIDASQPEAVLDAALVHLARSAAPARPAPRRRSTSPRGFPVDVARANIENWLGRAAGRVGPGGHDGRVPLDRLAVPGRTDPGVRARHARCGRAPGPPRTAPLAYLRLEPSPRPTSPPSCRLTMWPGGDERGDEPPARDQRLPLRPVTWSG